MLILDDLQTYDVKLMLKVYKLSFIEISNLHKVLRTHLTNLLLSYKQTKWEIGVYLEKKGKSIFKFSFSSKLFSNRVYHLFVRILLKKFYTTNDQHIVTNYLLIDNGSRKHLKSSLIFIIWDN